MPKGIKKTAVYQNERSTGTACGRFYHGNFRTVNALMKLHAKRCSVCAGITERVSFTANLDKYNKVIDTSSHTKFKGSGPLPVAPNPF